MHELIEQRHGERGVAMIGTPDHPLGDELASGRSQRIDFAIQEDRDISGTMRSRPQLGHRALVLLLGRGQAVEVYTEISEFTRKR